MKNDDWTNKLRERLADYQEPVETDLWASIEQSLVQQHILDKPKSLGEAKNYKIVKWAVAATVALMLAGGCYVYLRDDKPKNLNGKQSMLVAKERTSRASGSDVMSETVVGTEDDTNPILLALTSVADVGKTFGDVVSSVSVRPLVSEDSLAQKADEVSEKPDDHLVSRKYFGSKTQDSRPASNGFDGTVTTSRDGMSLNVKLYAENGLVGNLSLGGTGGDASAEFSSAPMVGAMFPSDNSVFSYTDMLRTENIIKEKHNRPVAIGMQVGVGVTPRISITTGVVYTKVESDFTVQGKFTTRDRSQVLHYIGVPLGINYKLWSLNNLHTYVNVGGECDVNVKNKTTEEEMPVDVKRDRPQWSTHASVGVQYDVVPQVGIYVEPGGKYYFDNGSDIRNTFKDKKLNFNFQFGLRVNLGK